MLFYAHLLLTNHIAGHNLHAGPLLVKAAK
jgi:hypothetical protein